MASHAAGDRSARRGKLRKNDSSSAGVASQLATGSHKTAPAQSGSPLQTSAIRYGRAMQNTPNVASSHPPRRAPMSNGFRKTTTQADEQRDELHEAGDEQVDAFAAQPVVRACRRHHPLAAERAALPRDLECDRAAEHDVGLHGLPFGLGVDRVATSREDPVADSDAEARRR